MWTLDRMEVIDRTVIDCYISLALSNIVVALGGDRTFFINYLQRLADILHSLALSKAYFACPDGDDGGEE